MTPSRQFKRGLWIKLSRRWDEQGLRSFAWYQQAWLRWSFAMLVGLVLVGSVGTGAYAYASPAVIEGTPLYPLKLKLESWEERLYRTPEQRAKFYLKKIRRREAEQQILENRRQKVEKTREQVQRLEDRLEKIERRFDERTPPTLRQEVRERLERRPAAGERRLNRGNGAADVPKFNPQETKERPVKESKPPATRKEIGR